VADFELRITSYSGIVPGAVHFRGRVVGESPKPCHGNVTHYNAPGHRGKVTCDEGHELPSRVEWDVEESWDQSMYDRWAARSFEGAGPQQFLTEDAVIIAAVARFDGTFPPRFWEEKPVVGQPGDRLTYDGEELAVIKEEP
jgi:hypothetical protein